MLVKTLVFSVRARDQAMDGENIERLWSEYGRRINGEAERNWAEYNGRLQNV